ncbi:MAG: hypothetical protein FJZ86_15365 [Chloroflexi bacterium]|nr:hypothetical protein [Chloroflexota bacterium]
MRAQFYGWYDSETQMLAGRDFTVDDIVQHVIEKTFSGERNWDPTKVLLFPWLKNQVKSVMDAWIKRESGKNEISFGDDENEDNEINHASAIKIEDTIDVNSPQPEMALKEKEIIILQSEVISRVFQAISGDKELEELFDAITETGGTKPIILADYLKIEIGEINNRKKRFQRRLSKIDPEQGQNEKQ